MDMGLDESTSNWARQQATHWDSGLARYAPTHGQGNISLVFTTSGKQIAHPQSNLSGALPPLGALREKMEDKHDTP
jgi:hypothetical protein